MKFTLSHEWIEVEGEEATIGITDFAQEELGEIVYVELPQVGKTVSAGEEAVVLESTKAAVDLYSPLSGEITAVNSLLKETPERVNTAPESEGWLFKLKLHDPAQLDLLMDAPAYKAYVSRDNE
jgi:glycine cleavage system H protein